MAEGDLSQTIDANYMGTFAELKDNSNNTVRKMSGVIDEIGSLVADANQGDFSTQIDLTGKTGFFLTLSDNLNTLNTTTNSGLSDILRVMKAMADGDLSQTIDANYMGTFADLKDNSNNTVKKMSSVMDEIGGLVADANQGDFSAQIDLTGKTGFFYELSDSLNTMVRTTDESLKDVIRVLGAIAEGNLTETIVRDYKGDFGQLKIDANNTVNRLTEVIQGLTDSSSLVLDNANKIEISNSNLNQRIEKQASSLDETASSMEEMTSIVRSTTENTLEVNRLSQNAAEIAEKGGEVVQKAVNAMDEINKSSKKIADIIGVIDEIAFQTNLLALNAAVEAARAGEQGRGFAVVAAEVRSLAQRSAEAAREINDLIGDSIVKVQDGTLLVNTSGDALTKIVTAVQEVSKMIQRINSAAAKQTSGIQQVNNAISQMVQITQQNAVFVDQATANGESMAEQSKQMNGLIDFFILARA